MFFLSIRFRRAVALGALCLALTPWAPTASAETAQQKADRKQALRSRPDPHRHAGLDRALKLRKSFPLLCGTSVDPQLSENVRNALLSEQRGKSPTRRAPQTHTGSRDVGEITLMIDDGTMVTQVPSFDLNGQALRFTPLPSGGYASESIELDVDMDFGEERVVGNDLFTRLTFAEGFDFPFFGVERSEVFVNANGNLTFGSFDSNFRVSEAFFVGPRPRIAPLFNDFNPPDGGKVFIKATADLALASWVDVPENDFATRSTFQVKMFPGGVIEFHYPDVEAENGAVGITPGRATVADEVDFSAFAMQPGSFAGALYERFDENFDLAHRAIVFTPNAAGGYDVAIENAELDPDLGARLDLGDDDTEPVELTNGLSVPLFGKNVQSFRVGSNGMITTDTSFPFASIEVEEFLAGGGRIAPLLTDLNPAQGGGVFFRQADDRAVFTWSEVPQDDQANANTFQVAMLESGVVRFVYGDVPARSGFSGISGGVKLNNADWTDDVPFDFAEAAGQLFGGAKAFDLDGLRLAFIPVGDGYRVETSDAQFDAALGSDLDLADDDSERRTLPFLFPFYGKNTGSIFVNSNGNLTIGAPDAIPGGGLGVLAGGAPRIAAAFSDLDPSAAGGIFLRIEEDLFVATWLNVPQFGANDSNSFQIVVRENGVVTIDYLSVDLIQTVVGLSPGELRAKVNLVDFTEDAPTGPLSDLIAETFFQSRTVDVQRVGQIYYRNHPDEIGTLVMFTNFGSDLGGALAFSQGVKNEVEGIGLNVFDASFLYGSRGGLRNFVNMNSLDVYPDDLNEDFIRDNSALSILAHEVGHRWLAFPDVEAEGLSSIALRGRQLAHWNFFFNSFASFVEGNQWEPFTGVSFISADTVSRYGPLDLYLMGLLPPGKVPPFFLILPDAPGNPAFPPTEGAVVFGDKFDLTVENVIAAEGPRIPAFPEAQRNFHVGFVLLTRPDRPATEDDLQKIERFREQFVPFFEESVEGLATLSTDNRNAAERPWTHYE